MNCSSSRSAGREQGSRSRRVMDKGTLDPVMEEREGDRGLVTEERTAERDLGTEEREGEMDTHADERDLGKYLRRAQGEGTRDFPSSPVE